MSNLLKCTQLSSGKAGLIPRSIYAVFRHLTF